MRDTPWSPSAPVDVSPEDYEKQVIAWLSESGVGLTGFEIQHRETLEGAGGRYQFDGLARFRVLGGAEIVVLVECKKHSRPVEREYLLSLESKLRDVGAHKAMIFSTAGFQRGAIEFASNKGIATITFIDGSLTYETRSLGPPPPTPPWVPRFAGAILTLPAGKLQINFVSPGHLEPLASWVTN